MERSRFTISCHYRNIEDNQTWVFMGVYGPMIQPNKEELWEDSRAIRGLWRDLWYIGGGGGNYFNTLRLKEIGKEGLHDL